MLKTEEYCQNDNMRTIILILTFASWVGNCHSAMPEGLEEKIADLRRIFATTASPDYRAQLLVVPKGISVDPPPDADNIENIASITITIESGEYFYRLHQLLDLMEESNWVTMSHPKYPRLYWRLVGPSNKVLLNFLIDPDFDAVIYNGKWYKVEGAFVESLKNGFLDATNENLR